MKIKITGRGIYGGSGEIAIGTELTVKEAPKGWAGRYVVLNDDPAEGAVAVTNPAKTPTDDDIAAMDKPALLAFLGDDWDGDKRLGVEKLREAALDMIAG